MASRRDQLQSYQFLVQRVVSALVLREADPAQTPFRRLAGATMVSVMVAVIALSGVAVFGFIRPGGKQSWRDGGRVIVEKETGAAYYFRKDRGDESDRGTLHPTANFASAALLTGSSRSVLVSRNSLVDVPRGPMLGIRDAPVALPPAQRLLRGPWTLCSTREPSTVGQLETRTVLFITGQAPPGGKPLGSTAMLVRDAKTSALWLVHRGRKHAIPRAEADAVRIALAQQTQAEAGTAWLDALPSGVALEPLALQGRGATTTAVQGARVGQVFRTSTEGGRVSYYVAVPGALRPITQLQAEILVAARVTDDAYPPGQPPRLLELSPAAAAAAPKRGEILSGPEQPPATAPEFSRPADYNALCVSFRDAGSNPPTVLFDARVAPPAEAVDTVERTVDGATLADRVVVREGWGALVESMPSPTASQGTLTLVTDNGRRYPLADRQVAETLGYDVPPLRLPASLVKRLPEGPGLDPEDALRRLE